MQENQDKNIHVARIIKFVIDQKNQLQLGFVLLGGL